MDRATILKTAERAVMVDREADHGSPENSFYEISTLWSAYLGIPILPYEVAVLMALFKVGRIKGNAAHCDSWTDLAGYAACGGELATGDNDGK